MNVLIVDDDFTTVECIRAAIDWENLGISTVCAAYHKNGAIAVLRRTQIDVVICDIEMPMGSGLDLLAWVREAGYGCEFIFLTCHDRFDFASAAIEYKAASYLLKPFDPEKMTAELIKAIERIEQNRQLHEYSRYGSYWLENKDDVEREFWHELLAMKIPARCGEIAAEAERRGVEIDTSAPFSLALFGLTYDTVTEDLRTESAQGVWEHRVMKLFLRELSALGGGRALAEWSGERLYVVCILPHAGDGFANCETLLCACKRELQTVIDGYFAESASFSQAANVFRALKKADTDNVSRGGALTRLQPQKRSAPNRVSLDLSPFGGLLAGGNKLQILNYLRGQLEALSAEQPLTPVILYAVQQDILQETYAYLHSHGIRLDLIFTDESYYGMMSNANTSMYNMMKWLSHFVSHVVDTEQELKKKTTVVEQVKIFIDRHFCEDISRNEAASAVFLTPEYLAKIFKKATGVSVNGYINAKRVALAKELLASSDMSVSEIAMRVGFGSSSYFVTIFRKALGVTPLEYRRALTAGEENP